MKLTREIKDIVIAWLALSVAFGFIFSGLNLFGILSGNFFSRILSFILLLPVSLFIVGTSFILHELGHRNVARHFNYLAEFRKWDLGLKIALGFAFLVGVIFAAPGAVYIGQKRKKTWEEKTRWDNEYPEYTKASNEMGLISVAGVVINVILGFMFLSLFYLFPDSFFNFVFDLGFKINFILAGFNLLPFGPLDGKKIMQWNPLIWGILFIPIAVWYFTVF